MKFDEKLMEHLIGNFDIRIPYSKQDVVLSSDIQKRIRSFKMSVSKRLGCKFDKLPENWTHDRNVLTWLTLHKQKDFPLWFSESLAAKLDKFSWQFSILPSWTFKYWWDPDKFCWDSFSCSNLVISQKEHFDTWWDPDKFNWEGGSWGLATYHDKKWKTWWDPDKFCFNRHVSRLTGDLIQSIIPMDEWWDKINKNLLREEWLSKCLANYRYNDFDIWWGTFKFYHSEATNRLLCSNCSKYFDKWYDQKLFDTVSWWRNSYIYLPRWCSDHFQKWYSPTIFRKIQNTKDIDEFKRLLIKFCSKNFIEWWDVRIFRDNFSKEFFSLLDQHCGEFRHIWESYFIQYKLNGEAKRRV